MRTIDRLTIASAMTVAALFVGLPDAHAETYQLTPDDDLAATLGMLEAGDAVVLSDGTYELAGGVDVTLAGTMGNRIAIRAAAGTRPILSADSGESVLRVAGTYFSIRGVEIAGPAAALTLAAENAFVEDVRITGGSFGIVCEQCTGVTISDVEVTGLDGGAAMQLGETRDSAITHNWVHDLAGETLGILIASPSSGNVVQDNVVTGVGGVGISVGDEPTGEINAIQGNWVADTGGRGIWLTGSGLVYNNVVARAGAEGIFGRLGVEGEARIEVLHNTVVNAAEACFRAEDWSLSSGQVVIANNAFYCAEGVATLFDDGGGVATITSNVFVGTSDRPENSEQGNGADDFEDAAADNFYPSMGSTLVDAGEPAWALTTDFNGTSREMAVDPGAYERRADSNPVPQPGGGFKADPADIPGDAGGVADAGPSPDGGTPDIDAGADGGGGPSGQAVTGGATGFDERDDGCGCGSTGAGASGSLLLLLLGFLVIRRR